VSERIRWEPAELSGFTGHVGTLEEWTFEMWESRGAGWALQSQLPGVIPSPGAIYRDSPDELKAEAESRLERFVSSLGAVFPAGAFEFEDFDEERFRAQFEPGRRVRFDHPDNGYPGEGAEAREILTLGAAYRIAWADIGQSKTTLALVGVEGAFNSVLFEPADDEETGS
jgi:hypothetical protein